MTYSDEYATDPKRRRSHYGYVSERKAPRTGWLPGDGCVQTDECGEPELDSTTCLVVTALFLATSTAIAFGTPNEVDRHFVGVASWVFLALAIMMLVAFFCALRQEQEHLPALLLARAEEERQALASERYSERQQAREEYPRELPLEDLLLLAASWGHSPCDRLMHARAVVEGKLLTHEESELDARIVQLRALFENWNLAERTHISSDGDIYTYPSYSADSGEFVPVHVQCNLNGQLIHAWDCGQLLPLSAEVFHDEST